MRQNHQPGLVSRLYMLEETNGKFISLYHTESRGNPITTWYMCYYSFVYLPKYYQTLIVSSARNVMDGPRVKCYLGALINTEPDFPYSIRYLFNMKMGVSSEKEIVLAHCYPFVVSNSLGWMSKMVDLYPSTVYLRYQIRHNILNSAHFGPYIGLISTAW